MSLVFLSGIKDKKRKEIKQWENELRMVSEAAPMKLIQEEWRF
jgi:hypothetical protein